MIPNSQWSRLHCTTAYYQPASLIQLSSWTWWLWNEMVGFYSFSNPIPTDITYCTFNSDDYNTRFVEALTSKYYCVQTTSQTLTKIRLCCLRLQNIVDIRHLNLHWQYPPCTKTGAWHRIRCPTRCLGNNYFFQNYYQYISNGVERHHYHTSSTRRNHWNRCFIL